MQWIKERLRILRVRVVITRRGLESVSLKFSMRLPTISTSHEDGFVIIQNISILPLSRIFVWIQKSLKIAILKRSLCDSLISFAHRTIAIARGRRARRPGSNSFRSPNITNQNSIDAAGSAINRSVYYKVTLLKFIVWRSYAELLTANFIVWSSYCKPQCLNASQTQIGDYESPWTASLWYTQLSILFIFQKLKTSSLNCFFEWKPFSRVRTLWLIDCPTDVSMQIGNSPQSMSLLENGNRDRELTQFWSQFNCSDQERRPGTEIRTAMLWSTNFKLKWDTIPQNFL